MMNNLRSSVCLSAGALFGVLLSNTASAQVTLTPTTVLNGSLYTYSYAVVNNSNDALAITTLNLGGISSGLTGLMAPMGFGIDFDSNLNLVSFFEDSDPATLQTFAPGTTISGFSFISPFAPTSVGFESLSVTGNTFSGNTLGPVAVPEAGTTALFLGLTSGMSAFLVRRRRNRH